MRIKEAVEEIKKEVFNTFPEFNRDIEISVSQTNTLGYVHISVFYADLSFFDLTEIKGRCVREKRSEDGTVYKVINIVKGGVDFAIFSKDYREEI